MSRLTGRLIGRSGARLTVAVLVVIAVFDPHVPGLRMPLDVMVLVDESLSMEAGAVERVWPELVQLSAAAPQGTRFGIMRFAATSVVEQSRHGADADALPAQLPRQQALDQSATNLEYAVNEALQHKAPRRSASIILVSDGYATYGDAGPAFQLAADAQVPVYLAQAEEASRMNDTAWIEDVQMPLRAPVGVMLPMTVGVAGNQPGEYRLEVRTAGRLTKSVDISVQPGHVNTIRLWLETKQVGVHPIELLLLPASGIEGSSAGHHYDLVLNVTGAAPLLVVTHSPVDSRIVDSLRQGGWDVHATTPAQFLQWQQQLPDVGAIVLENISILDMTAPAWTLLVDTVNSKGAGLLVLGGARSFGGGSYRHSQLESILPVTAESAQPQSPAAIMFVVDTSGSMGRAAGGPSRLALARQAILGTRANLSGTDQVGIVTFTDTVDSSIELAAAEAAGIRIEQALAIEAGGGTRLLPALEIAVAELAQTPLERRLLILVTDGFAGDEDLDAISRTIESEGIDVIALAVGNEPDLSRLQQLAAINRGKVFSVINTARLPRLMQQEVAQRRAPFQLGTVNTVASGALPFAVDTTQVWPALSGYMVTRQKPFAQVYLRSTQGDPLLAISQTGAGRVIAMPAGLGGWTEEWWRWPGLQQFIGGMLQYLSTHQDSARVSLQVFDQSDRLDYRIQRYDNSSLDSGDDSSLVVRDPSGKVHRLTLQLIAPGEYRATFPTTQPGIYRASLGMAGEQLQHSSLHTSAQEMAASPAAASELAEWYREGLVTAWPGVEELLREWPRGTASVRKWTLLCAVLVYLLVLFYEHGRLAWLGNKCKQLARRLPVSSRWPLVLLRQRGQDSNHSPHADQFKGRADI